MAAGNWTLFKSARQKFADGTFGDLATKVWRCKIYKKAVSASLSNGQLLDTFASLGTSNAAANMSAYTLSALTVTTLNGSATSKVDMAGDLVISASGGNATSIKYAVVYESAGGNLLMWCKLSTTSFDVTDTNTLTIYTPTNGFFVVY